MKIEKIHLKKLDHVDLEVLIEAANIYARHLRLLTIERKTAQTHIHFSISVCFGYEIFKKLYAHKKESSLNLDLFTAFVVLDSLHYYLDRDLHPLYQAKCSRMIQELDRLLPTVIDAKKFTVNSELYKTLK